METLDAWSVAVREALAGAAEQGAAWLPQLATALVLVGLGWAAGRLTQTLLHRSLRRLGLDRAAARRGAGDEEPPPSRLLGRLGFWAVWLTALLLAAETAGLGGAMQTAEHLLALLPRVVAAVLLLGVGLLLARLAGELVRSTTAAAGFGQARRLGAIARGAAAVVAVVVALGQLGVETGFLVTALTAIVGSVTLAAGLGLALGARGVVGHILAGHYLRQSLPTGRRAEVAGRSGVVERVGPVATVFRDGDRTWSIPNGRLLDEIVVH